MNCALKLVNEINLHYDARSEKHQSRSAVQIIVLQIQFLTATVKNHFSVSR